MFGEERTERAVAVERGTLVVESITTSDVATSERVDYWNERTSSFHRRMNVTPERQRDFHGRAVCCRTGAYQVVGWQSDAMVYRRTGNHVRADSDPNYRLVLVGAGRITLHGSDGSMDLREGAGGVMSMDAPFVLDQGPGMRGLVLTVPHAEVHRADLRPEESARPFDLTSGLGRILCDLVASLCRERNELAPQQFEAVAQRAAELMCMLLMGDDRPTSPGHLAELESAIRRYVRANAEAPDLNGTAIAHALGWSLRQIQLALQHAGTTPRELIREERLQLAYTRLQHPAFANRAIADLAHGVGFRSASAFSTAFRGRFGMSPRDLRAIAADSGARRS